MNVQVSDTASKLLSEIQWTGAFKVDELENTLVKSALKQGSKIGAYNPDGCLVFLENDIKVIEVPQS